MDKSIELTIQLADENNWHQIDAALGKKGGVYRLFAINGGAPCLIPRVLNSDASGTLYIGKANCFLDRVIDLKKSILPNYASSSHDAGVRYKRLTPLQQKYPVHELMVQLSSGDNPIEMEREALKSYIETFGEVPPLNAI